MTQARALHRFQGMADDKTKFILKEDFTRALSALMAADPVWGLLQAIHLVARAQEINREEISAEAVARAS